MDWFSRSLELSGDPETGLQETALLATHGFYPEALKHLKASENLLGTLDIPKTGVLARHNYPEEIKQLRHQIEEDMRHGAVKP